MTEDLEGRASVQSSHVAAEARKLRETRDPAYLELLDAALARAKGEAEKPRSRKWGYR
jgi:hypothetical protein